MKELKNEWIKLKNEKVIEFIRDKLIKEYIEILMECIKGNYIVL